MAGCGVVLFGGIGCGGRGGPVWTWCLGRGGG